MASLPPEAAPATMSPDASTGSTGGGPDRPDSLSIESTQGDEEGVMEHDPLRHVLQAADRELMLLAEFRQLQTRIPSGIYIAPSQRDSTQWLGMVFIRTGLFQGGIFRFRVDLTGYPAHVPDVMMVTDIFHPQILEGIVSEHVLRQNAPKNEALRVYHIVNTIKRILYTVDATLPTNQAAADVYNTDIADFSLRARAAALASVDDIHTAADAGWDMVVPEWNEDIHAQSERRILNGSAVDSDAYGPSNDGDLVGHTGLSFVKLDVGATAPGEYRVPFGRK